MNKENNNTFLVTNQAQFEKFARTPISKTNSNSETKFANCPNEIKLRKIQHLEELLFDEKLFNEKNAQLSFHITIAVKPQKLCQVKLHMGF